MNLSIQDRLLIKQLFPETSDIMTQVIARDIDKKISFTQEDIAEFNLKTENNVFTWDDDKAKDIDVSFSDAELKMLKEQVERLDRAKQITRQMLDTCLKIRDCRYGG